MTKQSLYLCLDQGGHSSRALIVDSLGKVRVKAQVTIATMRDGARVEHDPDELIVSLLQSAGQAVSELGDELRSLQAAGLATQRSSIVCWDAHSGEALSPVLSWQDTRAAEWLEQFAPHWQRVHQLTGLVLSPHYGVSKLVWCMQNLPQVATALQSGRLRCGPLASFVAMRLCGRTEAMADPANGSRTLLWDKDKGDWSDELLELFGVPREILPVAAASRAEWGRLRVESKKWPLSVVTGDQSAALFAFGQPEADRVYMNLGTGAFVQRVAPSADIDAGSLLSSVVYQDPALLATVVEGTVNGAGSALTRVSRERDISQQQLHDHATEWLEQTETPPLFINGIGGLGSPWWNSEVQSRFIGDDMSGDLSNNSSLTDPQAIAAVLESIVFMLAVNLQQQNSLLGSASGVVATGGLASIDALLQRLADLTGLVVKRTQIQEATSVGLAYLLAGLPGDWLEVQVESVFQPVTNDLLQGKLQARFEQWLEQMPAQSPTSQS